MPKGIYERPRPNGRLRKAAAEQQIALPLALEQACKNFELEAGGRNSLIEHLSHAPLSEDQQLLVGAIADPRNDKNSLARICYTYGIQFADLIQLFRAAGFAKAQVAAMRKVWEKLPDVAGDVMDRSTTHTIPCARCAGTGTFWRYEIPKGDNKVTKVEEPCEPCQGRGELIIHPKLETQKVALELGGLLQQKGGVEVNVLQQTGIAVPGSGRFYSDSDRALYPDAIETEARVLTPGDDEEGEPEP